MTGRRTYSETVSRGFYGRYQGGLSGKYDNVRTYWEDHLTRLMLRPLVEARVTACRRLGRGVRVLDLGCGAGQGYELLTSIPSKGLGLDAPIQHVLPSSEVEHYHGLDISDAMIRQGQQNYPDSPTITFERADLSEGLGRALAAPPYDIYFSSYGSLSHLDSEGLRRCLDDVAGHAASDALVVLDLLGRLSPEWPEYWSADGEEDKVRPYSMSYLYGESEREGDQVEQFPVRFWTGDEVTEVCHELSSRPDARLILSELMDRSVFVGRHVDTGAYGCSLPPLRRAVNSLFEPDVRTNLEAVLVDYRPVKGHPELNEFFAYLAACWNVLVQFTLERLRGGRPDLVSMDGWSKFPPALQVALMNMDRVVDSVAWFQAGDVRANIVEPQLAYLLQGLEQALQAGAGCGHGLVAVIAVRKT